MTNNNSHNKLHFFFFPFMAHGHMIPSLDLAKLLASKGAKSTILTTNLNSKPIYTLKNLNPNLDIQIKILDFPCALLGLPEGCENVDFFTSSTDVNKEEMRFKFFLSTKFFKNQLEQLLEQFRPDCLIADMFFPWATQVAEKFNVPRLVFHGSGYFSLSSSYCIRLHKPQKKVASNSESFVIPDLPGDILISSEQIFEPDEETEMGKLMKEVKESEVISFGVIVNSFYELEPAYAEFYKSVVAKKAWQVGPLSVYNKRFEEKVERGKKASVDEIEVLKWLDSKEVNSVVYMSFGSVACFDDEQLTEIAAGLEASGMNFIWVVRKSDDNNTSGEREKWLPQEIEEKIKGRGLIIRGWAPQVLILEHEATGGFVTHCGWNSLLEGVAAGLPMVTWPVGAEQFYNEKLVTQVLKTGVSVGVKKRVKLVGDFISRDKVEKAVRKVLVGEEAETRRRLAKELSEKAKAAVEEGGSSFNDLNKFMEEFSLRKRAAT